MSELKACPFCGGEAKEHIGSIKGGCLCSNDACVVFAKIFYIDTWNTRPTEDKLRERVKELDSVIDSNKRDWVTRSKSLHSKIKSLEQRVEELEAKNVTLDTDRKSLKFHRDGLRDENEKLREENETADEKYEEFESVISMGFNVTIEALEQKLESSELKLKEAVLALEVFKDCQSWSEKEKTCWEKGQILTEALAKCNKECEHCKSMNKSTRSDLVTFCPICGREIT